MTLPSIEHLFTLRRSPITLAPLIHQFYLHSKPREKDLLLSYLVIPMVLSPLMCKYLLTVIKTSNLRTLCNNQSRLIGLTKITQQFKPLTNAAILILKTEGAVEISENLTVKCRLRVQTNNVDQSQLEAARRLSMVLAESDVVSIYRTLGFKSL